VFAWLLAPLRQLARAAMQRQAGKSRHGLTPTIIRV